MLPSKKTFKKTERLSSKKEFDQLVANGSSFNKYPFRLIFSAQATDGANPVKAAISVPKKRIKLAVSRNRIKRLFREVYRLNKQPLVKFAVENKINFQLLFVFTGKTTDADFNIFTTKIILLLQRLQSTNEFDKRAIDTTA